MHTGRPIAGASVRLSGGPGEPRGGRPLRLTDSAGVFVFAGLEDGTYGLLGSASGFVEGDSLLSGGRAIVKLDGARRYVVADIALWRFATVTGVVVSDGMPAVGVEVSALRPNNRYVHRQEGPRSSTTDDRGRFRITGLPPGDYVIGAIPPSAPENSPSSVAPYAPLFYPGDRAGAGDVLMLQSGDVVDVGTLALVSDATSYVAGTLMGEQTTPAGIAVRAVVEVTRGGPGTNIVEVGRSRTDAAGRFRIEGLPRVNVILFASRTSQDRSAGGGSVAGPLVWARLPTVPGSDASKNAFVELRQGLHITGRATLGLQSAWKSGSNVRLRARPEGAVRLFGMSSDVTTAITDSGTFDIGPLLPGEYAIDMIGPTGWEVASVRQSGRETLGRRIILVDANIENLEVSVATASSELLVSIPPDSFKSGGPLTVFAFPRDTREWKDATLTDSAFQRCDAGVPDGCAFRGMPPGTYLVAVRSRYPPSDIWLRTDHLARLQANAVQASVVAGQRTTVLWSAGRQP